MDAWSYLPTAAAMIWNEIRRAQRLADQGCYRMAAMNGQRLARLAVHPDMPADLRLLAGAAARRLERRLTAALPDHGTAA